MICVFARNPGNPASLESLYTKFLAWGFHSDHPSIMDSGCKLPWQLAVYKFSGQRFFSLSILNANVWGSFPDSSGGVEVSLFLMYIYTGDADFWSPRLMWRNSNQSPHFGQALDFLSSLLGHINRTNQKDHINSSFNKCAKTKARFSVPLTFLGSCYHLM